MIVFSTVVPSIQGYMMMNSHATHFFYTKYHILLRGKYSPRTAKIVDTEEGILKIKLAWSHNKQLHHELFKERFVSWQSIYILRKIVVFSVQISWLHDLHQPAVTKYVIFLYLKIYRVAHVVEYQEYFFRLIWFFFYFFLWLIWLTVEEQTTFIVFVGKNK